jgi:hypothetical protein
LKELEFKLNKTNIKIIITPLEFGADDFSHILKENYEKIFVINEFNRMMFPEKFHEQFNKFNELKASYKETNDDTLADKLKVMEGKIFGQYAENGQIGLSIHCESDFLNVNKFAKNGNDKSRNGYDGLLVNPKKNSIHFLESKSTFKEFGNTNRICTEFVNLFQKSVNTLYGVDNENKKEESIVKSTPLEPNVILNRITSFGEICNLLVANRISNSDILKSQLLIFTKKVKSLVNGQDVFLDIDNQIHGLTIFVEDSLNNIDALAEKFKQSIIDKYKIWIESEGKKRMAKDLKLFFERIKDEKIETVQINLALLNNERNSIIEEGLKMTSQKEWWYE